MGGRNINCKKAWHPTSRRTRLQVEKASTRREAEAGKDAEGGRAARKQVPLESVFGSTERMPWMI